MQSWEGFDDKTESRTDNGYHVTEEYLLDSLACKAHLCCLLQTLKQAAVLHPSYHQALKGGSEGTLKWH